MRQTAFAPTTADSATVLMGHALRLNQLFCNWPEPLMAELVAAARLERYARRTQILSNDRHRRELLVVVTGCLEISGTSALGRKYVHALLGPGQVASLVRLLDEVPLAYDFHAHEASTLIHLPCDPVLALLDTEPVLWRDVAKLMLQRQRQSLTLLHHQMLATVRSRVAATLLSLSRVYGAPDPGRRGMHVPLSQNDLAAMLTLSRQTVNKELGLLVAQGVITLRYKRIAIIDTDALRRIAKGH